MFIHAVIQSANDVVALKSIELCRYRSGAECDLSDFDHGLIVVPDRLV